jgi:CheY-like chemotaxis protein
MVTIVASNTPYTPLPILIVEDSPQWQQAFSILLQQHTDKFALVGIAETPQTAQQLVQQTPHANNDIIVLLDWELPEGETGLTVFNALQPTGIQTENVILVSGTDTQQLPPLPFKQIPKTKVVQQLIPTLLSRWEQHHRAFHADTVAQATA